ncbi:MAG: hypothetical protein Q8N06_15430, partial [Hydrogenophaga sp.]|nr:hypothetical protein [Hydrogenophaga sp.]
MGPFQLGLRSCNAERGDSPCQHCAGSYRFKSKLFSCQRFHGVSSWGGYWLSKGNDAHASRAPRFMGHPVFARLAKGSLSLRAWRQ